MPTVVRGGGVRKNSFHTSSNPAKLSQGGVEDLSLDDMVQRGAGRLEGPAQVLEDEPGLSFDVRAIERKRPGPRGPRGARWS